MSKEVILTGLRSNSELHLGNYLGAILPMVELQKKHAGQYQLNMFIPDLHSITTEVDYSKIHQQALDNLKMFVAAGLDIDQPDTFIYRQSYIPAHSEMTWILSCFTHFGELNRMTQFKERVEQVKVFVGALSQELEERNIGSMPRTEDYKNYLAGHNVSSGLFLYPVLMASDILLYGAKWVPVGEDQRQHVELARDLAIRLNVRFKKQLLIEPKEWSQQLNFMERDKGVRIRSLRHPEKKMSKSVQDPAGTIMLTDSPDEAAKKVLSATTDSLASINYDWEKQPGIANLLQILALLSRRPQNEVNSEWQGKNSYDELKRSVAEAVKSFLSNFRSKLAEVDQHQLMQKLEADEEAMRKIADQKLLEVQKAVGLRPRQ